MGVGILRGRGFLGFLVSWFLAVLVSWFHSFLVSWFQSFLVSKFLGFLVSKFLGIKAAKFQSFNDPILPKSISCFLVHIDPIFKMFKFVLHGSSSFPVSVFSENGPADRP